jgi:hypothetical protein
MNTTDFVKKYHRHFFWILIAILFVLDIITTTIGLQVGFYEQTLFMIPFVGNPILHVIIKLIAFVILFVVLEGLLKIFEFNSQAHLILDLFLTFALIYVCWLFLNIVIKNIQVILR